MLGDTHGNPAMVGLLPVIVRKIRKIGGIDSSVPLGIVQLGDFGFWPHKIDWMRALSDRMAQDDVNAALWFVDGNHENHHMLGELSEDEGLRGPDGEVAVMDRVGWLPRGTRWEWSNVRLAAMGGAVSIDQSDRTLGYDWFEEEAITYGQYRRFESHGGRVDVLFTHDAPSVELPWSHLLEHQHGRVFSNSTANRMTLEEIASCCDPRLVVHGHWHIRSSYVARTVAGNKPYRVEALSFDHYPQSMASWLDLSTLEVTDPPGSVKWSA